MVVQLATGTMDYNILIIETYTVSFLKRWGRGWPTVCTPAVTVLGAKDFSREVFLDLFQLPHSLVGIGLR
jgi:hypothetical protein